MKKKLSFIICLLAVIQNFYAQDSIWTLSKCIQYARIHNLQVKQSELDIKAAKMVYTSSKYSFLPSLNLSSGYGISFGRSINPTTNQFDNTKFSSINLSASSSVLLFGWFQKKYAVQGNELKYKTASGNLEELKDNILLNTATAYLRVLLANDQIENIKYQLELSRTNKLRIEKLIDAGKSNVLELSQSNNELFTDNSYYLQSLMEYEQALIDLKVLLNVEFSENISAVSEDKIDNILLEEIEPEEVYKTALKNVPSIENSHYNIQIVEKDIQLAKAKQLPQLSMYYSSGTNYSSSYYEYLSSQESRLMPFWRQFSNNISNSFGVSLSIPVFNNFSSRDAVRSSKINLEKAKIGYEEMCQKLKQDVYKACIDYKRTFQKYKSQVSALKNAETSLKAATARYQNGFIPYFEYLTVKNSYLKSQNDTSALKYEAYFKRLVIDYYLGLID